MPFSLICDKGDEMRKAIRKIELVGTEVPDTNYPPGDGRTATVWSYEYAAITVPAYPLKKKYR